MVPLFMLGTIAQDHISTEAANRYISKHRPKESTGNHPDQLLLAPKEQTQRIMARPVYLPDLPPRSDPFANTGSIRGTFPEDLGHTAVNPYPMMTPINHLPEQPKRLYGQVSKPLFSFELPTIAKPSREFFNESAKKDIFLISSPSSKTIQQDMHSTMSSNHSTRMALEPIDEPFSQEPLRSSDFSRLGDLEDRPQAAAPRGNRPDLSLADPQQLLPKTDLRYSVSFKDPSDPSNYMYDRTLFAPLKRRNGNIGTDFVRGDIYIAPTKFGWFDTPSNPGTDLNPGFFNLNYPSFQQNVSEQETSLSRVNPSYSAAQFEQMKGNNPFAGEAMRRGP